MLLFSIATEISYVYDFYINICILLQMIDIFGTLLDRPVIHEDFKSKYPCILGMIETDLDEVKRIFDHHIAAEAVRGTGAVNKNMPNVAGALKWAQELRYRLKAPLNSLNLSFSTG